MTAQLDLFAAAAPAPARRPAKPDTALLLAMSRDHTPAPAAPSPTPAPPPLPRTGGELVDQSRGCCSRCEARGHPSIYTWHDDTQELLCHPCNAGKLGYSGTPNEHGVYVGQGERISLPRTAKGWQGSNTADIKLLDLGPHWIWATGYELHGGDFRGSSTPLSDHESRRAPTREAALEAAKAHLHEALRDCDNPDARRVLDWLGTLGQGALI